MEHVLPQATVAESLQAAANRLTNVSESPRLDAELLLCLVLGWPRSRLQVRGDQSVPAGHHEEFASLIERRLGGAPVAYLTGRREFWSLPLAVTPDVLVPRPETEVLVEKALELIAAGAMSRVLELGTGSGAIALALAAERPHAHIVAVDVSAAALAVAVRNGVELARTRAGLAAIEWRLGSWFEPVAGERFDLIVSNPPYVAADDPALDALGAEPALALTPGRSGLEALATLIEGAPAHLAVGGWLVLEHGCTQADEVMRLLTARGFRDIRSHLDYSSKPRVTLGSFHSAH